ncbi:MAG: MBL fold metallo-hydrolase [Polyangia bacterium]
MFGVTFLGHQGWMFRTKRASILVDPLLCDAFGHAHALGYDVFPPRVIDLGKFPALDAVVLTHEHDDHFDLPTLALLDRKIPIYLSSRSSIAAREILRRMGFAVHPLSPGRPLAWKDLQLLPFAGDHVSVNCGDEWDTLPYIVKQKGGSGSFFSLVDISITPAHIEWAKTQLESPGIVAWTNNALDWSHMADWLGTRDEATQDCFVKLGMGHKLIETVWGKPAATMFCAGGFSFTGDRAWLNQRVFCVDVDAICAAMMNMYKGEVFLSTLPGQTFWMQGNRVHEAEDETSFLRIKPPAEWPSRHRDDGVATSDFEPATGARGFDDVPQLEAHLQELADALVAGAVFRGLHSLRDDELDERAGTFAFLLRRDGAPALAYEYVPTACAFRRTDADVRTTHLAGLECWASDLDAVIAGELGPIALTYGRSRLWNALPTRFHFDVFSDLYRVSHPLRRPAATLRVYEKLLARAHGIEPRISFNEP